MVHTYIYIYAHVAPRIYFTLENILSYQKRQHGPSMYHIASAHIRIRLSYIHMRCILYNAIVSQWGNIPLFWSFMKCDTISFVILIDMNIFIFMIYIYIANLRRISIPLVLNTKGFINRSDCSPPSRLWLHYLSHNMLPSWHVL